MSFYHRKTRTAHFFQDKTGRQSDYSRFQGVNMHKPAAYLNKQESSMKLQVVAPYTISSDNLLPVSYTLDGDWLETDIKLGNITMTGDTSILKKSKQKFVYFKISRNFAVDK